MSKNITGLSAIGQETGIERDHIFFDIFQFFFLNIYLRCKNFQCSMGIRLLVRERYVHIYRQIASLLSAPSLLRMSWSSCMLSDSYHIYVIVDGWFNC